MKRIVRTVIIAVAAAAMTVLPQSALAQGRGGSRGQGGPGGRGYFDPAQMRQRMMERFQEQLGASDEEWKVIQPLIEDVMTKQRAASSSRFGGMAMLFRPRGEDQGGQRSPRGRYGRGEPDPAVQALAKAIQDKNTPASEIKAKLKAVRSSRTKAEAELKAAREKLRAVLTLRQEAQLVLMGQLD